MIKKSVKILVLIAIPVLATLLFLLIGEISMRWVFPSWKNEFDKMVDFKYDDRTHIANFREGSVVKDKKKGEYRILAVGDSFTWGVYVRDTDKVWPVILEKDLRRDTGRDVKVLNLGREAFTTFNEYELINKFGWNLEPDLIVLQFNLNDPLPSDWGFIRIKAPQDIMKLKNLIPNKKLNAFFQKHSLFYTFINGHFRDMQLALFHPYFHNELYDEDYAGWKQCKQAMFTLAVEARERNIPVVFVIFPVFMDDVDSREKYPYLGVHDKVRVMGEFCGFYVLDLLDAYLENGKSLSDWYALKLDHHPNEAAHELAADKIESFIKDKKIIK